MLLGEKSVIEEPAPPHPQGFFRLPWISTSSPPPPLPDVRVPATPPVGLPPGIQSPPASDTGSARVCFRPLECPLQLRVDDAFASLREDDEDWVDGWHCRLSCADGKRATLVSHLYPAHEPPAEFLKKSTAPTGRPSAPTSTAGAQLTSSRSSPGTLGLHAALVSALWPTT